MNFGLEQNDIVRIKAVFAYFPEVEKAIIYGSRAKGNSREGSDIDICLVGKQINLTILNAITQKTDELNLPYMFDISVYHQISNEALLEHINRVGIDILSEDGSADNSIN
ncbi:MAG: hypothetical protein K0Q79_783 [Flavipsychrobacter sp.]|jgi:predicted nucleotidyltransferase|nr:hypothetical protein [Flavipsychrobacter sp.]